MEIAFSCPEDVIGKVFGTRTAIEYRGSDKNGHMFLFKCSCGLESVIPISQILNGKRTSCPPCALRLCRSKRKRFNGRLNPSSVILED